jgi:hypothetical protein
MAAVQPDERAEFPAAGFRARRWRRFERDLHAWLATPEGRFARWRARQALTAAKAPVRPGSSRRAL